MIPFYLRVALTCLVLFVLVVVISLLVLSWIPADAGDCSAWANRPQFKLVWVRGEGRITCTSQQRYTIKVQFKRDGSWHKLPGSSFTNLTVARDQYVEGPWAPSYCRKERSKLVTQFSGTHVSRPKRVC